MQLDKGAGDEERIRIKILLGRSGNITYEEIKTEVCALQEHKSIDDFLYTDLLVTAIDLLTAENRIEEAKKYLDELLKTTQETGILLMQYEYETMEAFYHLYTGNPEGLPSLTGS